MILWGFYLFFAIHPVVNCVVHISSLQFDYRKFCTEILPGCKFISVRLTRIDKSSLSKILDNDFDNSAKNLIVEIKTEQSISEFAHDFDNFLAPRPWWMVREQPFSSSINIDQSIVLHRLPAEFLEYSKSIADINFPQEMKSCENRPVFVSAQTGTWGNGLLNMQGQYNHYSRAIFIPLTTRTLDKNDKVFLADENACPHIINKWECLFLPSTTCPWPDVVKKCHSEDCVPIDDRGYLSSASAKGVIIKDEELRNKISPLPQLKRDKTVSPAVMYQSKHPDSIITAQTSFTQARGGGDVLESHFLYGVVTRFNAHFRGLVQEVINEFRVSRTPMFHPNMSCVAIHVRRDDRALPGVDMMEWCRNHTIVDSNGQMKQTGLWVDGSDLSDGQWMDMGCNKKLPYGAASLEHFLNASRVLIPHNRNVFMMTDDPKWLRTEIKKYYSQRRAQHQHSADTMHIFTPPIRPNHRGGTYNSSVDFWASISMARQCQAVVGHLGSAAFVVIYNNLCYFHDNQFFNCPPLYNIAG